MENNYFFVDGAALLADIKKVRDRLRVSSDQRFDLVALVKYFAGSEKFHSFHSGQYRRFVFYFVREDDRMKSIKLPEFWKPGEVADVQVRYCGMRVKTSVKAGKWLDDMKAPEYVRECLYRSEKAVDTQICCDALQLLALSRLDRLFLYTNDSDFIPLCQTLRQMGANVNLFRIEAESANKTLASECDAFHVMDDERSLRACFSPTSPQ